MSCTLKGQCHEIFDHFLLKKFYLGPIWTAKNSFANLCPRSQRLRWHTGNYFTLENVKNQHKNLQKSNLIFRKLGFWEVNDYAVLIALVMK